IQAVAAPTRSAPASTIATVLLDMAEPPPRALETYLQSDVTAASARRLEAGGWRLEASSRSPASDRGVGDLEGFVESGQSGVDLGFGDDERRSDDQVADPPHAINAARHHVGSHLVDDQGLPGHLHRLRGERFLGGAVLHEVNRPEEAQTADVPHARMALG